MQVENVFPVIQRHVGVVPDQVFHRVHLGKVRHQDSAGRRAQLVVHRHVGFLFQIVENGKQSRRFFVIGSGKVPLAEIFIRCGTEEAPAHHAGGINKVLHEIVGLGDFLAVEGGRRDIVEALETAALQQLGEAALQCHLKTRVSTEGGKHPAGTRVHQRHAHHRELPTQGGILDQYREALFFQCLDAFHNLRVLGQHGLGYIRQGNLFFDDVFLHCPLEDFRQALHLGFGQGVARAHAVTEEQVFDQVGGEVHRLAIGVAHKGQ